MWLNGERMIRNALRAGGMLMAPLLLLVACGERVPAGPRAALPPGQAPGFFAAAVRHFASRTEVPILVDPRPLRPESALGSVAASDLMASETETIRMRTRVVESGGWRTTDAPDDWRCVFSQGLPPAQPPAREPPDTLRLRRDACREKGPYESLVFGLPQSGTEPGQPDRWRIRTMRMLPYGYEVVDLFLQKNPDGEWTVVDARVRSGVFS